MINYQASTAVRVFWVNVGESKQMQFAFHAKIPKFILKPWVHLRLRNIKCRPLRMRLQSRRHFLTDFLMLGSSAATATGQLMLNLEV